MILIENSITNDVHQNCVNELDKKISDFVKNDPYFKLTNKLASQFYQSIFDKTKIDGEIN